MTDRSKFDINTPQRINQVINWLSEGFSTIIEETIRDTSNFGYIIGYEKFYNLIINAESTDAVYLIVESMRYNGINTILKPLYKEIVSKFSIKIQEGDFKRKNDLIIEFKRNNRPLYLKIYIINGKSKIMAIDKKTGKFVTLPKKYNIKIE